MEKHRVTCPHCGHTKELTIEEQLEEARKQIADLQKQVAELQAGQWWTYLPTYYSDSATGHLGGHRV